MSWARRAVTLLASSLLIAPALAILAVTLDVKEPAALAAEGWFRDQLSRADAFQGQDRALAVLLAAVALAVGVGLLFAETASKWRGPYLALGGDASVRQQTIERLVLYAGQQVHGVLRAHSAQVRHSRRGLLIDCHALLRPDARAIPASAELRARIGHTVGGMTGLPVARLRLRLERHTTGGRVLIGSSR